MLNYQDMMQDTFDEIVQIGAGGGGTVFKAHHRRLDKEVVLKKIHAGLLKNIDRRAELDILKKLKNNYIPQIFDFIEYGDEVFTVMEYIPGKSFAQLLEQKTTFTQKDVVKWARQLCEVVDYLHSQSPPVIHCDIKPANIMLTPAGDICLIDFNISGVKSEEGTASIGYSSGYAPVEQFAVVMRRFIHATPESVEKRTVDISDSVAKTESISIERGNETEITSADGGEQTEITPTDGGEQTEITPSDGGEQTEITPVDGGEQTEITSADGGEETEITPAGEDDQTKNGSGGRKTENTVPVRDKPSSVEKKPMVSTSLSPGKCIRSPMRSMSDEEWTAAVEVVDSVGNNLMIDERTDIYSVGATLYHILTGQKPQPFYRKQVPIIQLRESASESLIYVIEKAMALNPAGRFKNSGQLLKVIRNLGIVNKQYKSLTRKQVTAAVMTGILTVASVLSVLQGRSLMAQEQMERYWDHIAKMREAREERDYDAIEKDYGMALEIDRTEPDAYYEMALACFAQGSYEQCIDFISRNVYTNPDMVQESNYGRFYYITASCYFELADYSAAVPYYERALELQPEEVSYYRDFVVALARNGQVDRAEGVLSQAVEKGVSADIISLMNGEIALLRGDLEGSEHNLLGCLEEASDDYIRLRAYTKLDDIYCLMYDGAQQYDIRIEYLQEALSTLAEQYQVTLMERLAQVYIDYSDIGDRDACCEDAIDLFKQMEDRGYATFTSRYNVAVLYEKMESYSEAQAQLTVMLDLYPDQYTVYKRMAFLELDMQAVREREEREYHTFDTYYGRAQELYQERSNGEDMEMLSLQQLYNDVVTNGWL